MIKRLIRTCVATGCMGSGLVKLAESLSTGLLTILCYHRVLPAGRKRDYFNPDLVVTPETFHEHCRILKRFYKVLPLSQAMDAWPSLQPDDPPLAVITFDDGYRDNHQFAAPILQDTGLKATFFVITDLIGSHKPPWHDRLARGFRACMRSGRVDQVLPSDTLAKIGFLDRQGTECGAAIRKLLAYAKSLPSEDRASLVEQVENGVTEEPHADDRIMDWPQIEELSNNGHEIGSHTCRHEILTLLDEDRLKNEIVGSRLTLQDRLRVPVRSFCYPNGNVDDRVRQMVESAGYTAAVSTSCGSNSRNQDPLKLQRRFIHEERMSHLLGRRSSWLLRMELCGLADVAFLRRRRMRGHL